MIKPRKEYLILNIKDKWFFDKIKELPKILWVARGLSRSEATRT
ncbi:protein of unknown function [Methanocaldococcus lauensis]|nr:protein of unknown function [Methanocaldococcus lauensis]